MIGKERVKEPVASRPRHPKAHLLQVNGVKAISHTPDRDRVLPIVPKGTRQQTVRNRSRKEGAEDGLRKETK